MNRVDPIVCEFSGIVPEIRTQVVLCPIHTANGTYWADLYSLDVMLPNGMLVQGVTVSESDLKVCDVLIGMNIISMGDMKITNRANTKFVFRIPSEGDAPRVPLKLAEKPNFLRLFMNDVGLLSAMYMDGIQVKTLNGETAINFGSVYENAVAQELTAHGFAPRYFNSSAHGEIDFVVEKNGGVLPVEVKSGKHYKRHRALAHMMDDPEFGMESALVLDDDALDVEGKLFYAPNLHDDVSGAGAASRDDDLRDRRSHRLSGWEVMMWLKVG